MTEAIGPSPCRVADQTRINALNVATRRILIKTSQSLPLYGLAVSSLIREDSDLVDRIRVIDPDVLLVSEKLLAYLVNRQPTIPRFITGRVRRVDAQTEFDRRGMGTAIRYSARS